MWTVIFFVSTLAEAWYLKVCVAVRIIDGQKHFQIFLSCSLQKVSYMGTHPVLCMYKATTFFSRRVQEYLLLRPYVH